MDYLQVQADNPYYNYYISLLANVLMLYIPLILYFKISSLSASLAVKHSGIIVPSPAPSLILAVNVPVIIGSSSLTSVMEILRLPVVDPFIDVALENKNATDLTKSQFI